MSSETRYHDLVPLGDAPAATVLAAVETRTGQAYALRVLPGVPDRRTRKRLENELSRLGPLGDRAPILVADRLEEFEPGRWALRMELCSQSLDDLIDAFGPLSIPDAVALGATLAQALAAAHAAGVPHGALTPGNVLFRPDGAPVLADFGPVLRDTFRTDPATRITFLAPETIRDETVDERSDLYGLGALLYLALTGLPPHHGPPGERPEDRMLRVLGEPAPAPAREDLPERLAELVTELLAGDPSARPPDAVAVLRRIEHHAKATAAHLDQQTGSTAANADHPAGPAAAPAEGRAGSAAPRRADAPGGAAPSGTGPPVPVPAGRPIVEFGPRNRPAWLPRPPWLVAASVGAALAVTAALLLPRRHEMLDAAPVTPAPATAEPAPVTSPTVASIELTRVVDQGEAVELSWRGNGPLDYAVIVAEEGRPPQTILVQRQTSRRVPVDPVRRYCFEIQGTNGPKIFFSAPAAIRGAVCGR